MLKFDGPKNLKAWLIQHPIGKQILNELFTEAELHSHLLAVRHHDRVDLYGHGPCSVTEVVQIHATTPTGEILAEQILDESLSLLDRQIKWPSHARLNSPGLIASLSPRKLTIQEYEWWQAYRDCMEIVDNGRT